MLRFKTFRRSVIVYVMAIMACSGMLSVGLYSLLERFTPIDLIEHLPFSLPVLLVLTSVLIGWIVSLFLTRYFFRPIIQLIYATRAMAKGDFSIRCQDPETKGELADLVRSVNTLAEELGNLEIFRTDFIDTFSHEFKTPMVSIHGFAKQLKNPDLTQKQREEYADIILDESRRLLTLSQNSLLLTKYDNQEIIPDRTVYRLDEQIRRCMQSLQREWIAKELEIVGEMDEVSCYGNEELTAHIWMNLLSNAIKFSPKGGKLTVWAESDEDIVTVEIADEGPGMTPEVQKHIFDRFYQGDPSRKGEGNGLGLPIVKRLVELSGGSVDFVSAPGKGSRFTVTLPCHEDRRK
ncbi:MAG: HAMP domain-containing histidine kinase [Oscillospiraceae bacterium]|nr:HAMP domain-containing histidine kinase [Oscillospiraceae bacterium]